MKIKIILPVMLAGKMYIPGTREKPKIIQIAPAIAADLIERGIAEPVKEDPTPATAPAK